MSRFMKGAFKLRSTSPKYDRTLDIGVVLSVVKAWVPLESLKFDLQGDLSLRSLTS